MASSCRLAASRGRRRVRASTLRADSWSEPWCQQLLARGPCVGWPASPCTIKEHFLYNRQKRQENLCSTRKSVPARDRGMAPRRQLLLTPAPPRTAQLLRPLPRPGGRRSSVMTPRRPKAPWGGALPGEPARAQWPGARRTSAALSCIAGLPVCCPTAMRPALKTLTLDHRALQQTLIFKLLLLVFGSASGTFHLCLRADGEERACVCGREEREHAPARARARARARGGGEIERVCACV